MNKTLINDKKTAGFVVGVIAGIIIYRTWSTYQTLPSDFLNLSQEEQSKIDNIIIRNGKPIGVCECLGKGKEKCKGNGWVRDENGYQRCPYFEPFDK